MQRKRKEGMKQKFILGREEKELGRVKAETHSGQGKGRNSFRAKPYPEQIDHVTQYELRKSVIQ